MISPDAFGYKCCKPPAHLHISSQCHCYASALGGRPPLDPHEERAVATFLLAGHSTVEAAKHFHKNRRTIGTHMRSAGYVFNGHTRRWVTPSFPLSVIPFCGR